jgi:5'-nucleotidase/UDP-sugar diphosphatase
MNLMGFDAMTIGNHEFDKPFSVLKEQQKLAKFNFVASNIMGADGKPIFESHIMKTFGDKKVAIVGFTTPDIPKVTPKAHTAGLSFLDPKVASGELVKKLKQEANLVIGLSHLGYYPQESHGLNSPGDETLAKNIPELDIIVGAHTHTELAQPVKIQNTLIVQAKESGHFVGRMDIDLSSGKPVVQKYELIPVKGFAPDKAVQELLQPYLDEGHKQFSRVVGKATSGFEGSRNDFVKSERPMGNFVAEAQRSATGADIGLVRAKILRNGFSPGDVQLRNLLSLNPLGHVLITADLNGSEIWRLVEAAKKNMLVAGNRPYFSEGFNVEIEGDQIKRISLKDVNIPNAPTGKYKVSMADAIAELIGDFAFVKDHPTFKNSGIQDVQATESYLKKVGTLDSKNHAYATFEPKPLKVDLSHRCLYEALVKLLEAE